MDYKCNLLLFLLFIHCGQIQISLAQEATALKCFSGVQIFTTTASSFFALNHELRWLRRHGIESIIFRCFKNPGDTPFHLKPEYIATGVYFASTVDPIVSDILSEVVKIAHKNNMQCFAWITTRSSQWILCEHPEWDAPVFNFERNEFQPSGKLDVFNENVIMRLSSLMTTVARTGVDGILIQDDWVSRQGDDLLSEAWRTFNNGVFKRKDLNLLFKRTKDSIQYLPAYYRWTRYKSQKLAETLERIVASVKAQRPDLKIALNIYYETVTKPSKSRTWLSQDIEDLFQFCPSIDLYAIMAYQHQMSVELNLSLTDIHLYLQNAYQKLISHYLVPPDRILWKIQGQDWKTGRIIDMQTLKFFLKIPRASQSILVPYRSHKNAIF